MSTMAPSTLPLADLAAALVAGLDCHRPASADLPDGRWLTLAVEVDQDMSVTDDGDWFGELAPVGTDRDTGRDTPRPSHFDGRARKLHAHRSYDGWWWQPPADVTDPEMVETMARTIVRLMEEGYHYVQVALWERLTDSTGHDHDVRVTDAALYGIDLGDYGDPHRDAYLAEVAADLVAEVLG